MWKHNSSQTIRIWWNNHGKMTRPCRHRRKLMQNPVNLSSLGQFPVMRTEMQHVCVTGPRDVSTLQNDFLVFCQRPYLVNLQVRSSFLSKHVIITALFVFTASCIKWFLALSMHVTSGRLWSKTFDGSIGNAEAMVARVGITGTHGVTRCPRFGNSLQSPTQSNLWNELAFCPGFPQ